jgi:hypothetical protein
VDVEPGVYGTLSVCVTEPRLAVLYDSSSVKASRSGEKKVESPIPVQWNETMATRLSCFVRRSTMRKGSSKLRG